MPTITLVRSHLFEAIGQEYTDEQFDELCFEFGVEVDGIETQIVEVTRFGSTLEPALNYICIVHCRWN